MLVTYLFSIFDSNIQVTTGRYNFYADLYLEEVVTSRIYMVSDSSEFFFKINDHLNSNWTKGEISNRLKVDQKRNPHNLKSRDH